MNQKLSIQVDTVVCRVMRGRLRQVTFKFKLEIFWLKNFSLKCKDFLGRNYRLFALWYVQLTL